MKTKNTITEVFVPELKSPIMNVKFKGFIAVGHDDDNCCFVTGTGDTPASAVDRMLDSTPTDKRLITNRRCFEVK